MNDDKRGPGRPKGSKNKSEVEVTRRLPACPLCGSVDILQRPGARVTTVSHGGVTPDGVGFTGVRWLPSYCRSCGQALVVREVFDDGARVSANGGGK